jgi:PAS domain S-box-containing protein
MIHPERHRTPSPQALDRRGGPLAPWVRAFARARSGEELAAHAARAARELLPAEGAAFAVREGDGFRYLEVDGPQPLWAGRRFRLSDCIAGWVLQHGRTAAVEDALRDGRLCASVFEPTYVRSLAAAPVGAHAAIEAYWPDRHRATEEELEILEAIADLAGLQLDNLRLHEETARVKGELQEILDHAPAVIFVKDLDDRCRVANRALEQLLGKPREEILGKRDEEIFGPEFAQGFADGDRAALDAPNGRGHLVEERVPTLQGPRTFRSLKFPLRDAHGRPYALCGISLDVTEEKRAQEAARESRARERARAEELHTVLESTPMIVLIAHDPEARHISGNEAALRILRMPPGANSSLTAPEEQRPRHFRVFHAGRELAPHELPVQRAARGEEIRNFEEEVVFDDGSRIRLLGNAVPLRNPEGAVRGAVAAFADITERVRAEEALRDLNGSLEARIEERTRALQDALQELDAFAYTIAHDLRSPIRSIHRWGEILLEDFGDDLRDEAGRYVGRMLVASNRMDALIRDLLAFIRLGRAELLAETLDVDAVVDDALRVENPALEESRARVEVGRPLGRVRADRGLLTQALAALVSNAAKFTVPGRPPRIEVRTEPVEPGRLRIWVEDRGIGVEPGDRDRLFRVFERLESKRRGPGNGMGLAIVKRICERMGGGVGYRPREGGGSSFHLDLPAAGEPDDR